MYDGARSSPVDGLTGRPGPPRTPATRVHFALLGLGANDKAVFTSCTVSVNLMPTALYSTRSLYWNPPCAPPIHIGLYFWYLGTSGGSYSESELELSKVTWIEALLSRLALPIASSAPRRVAVACAAAARSRASLILRARGAAGAAPATATRAPPAAPIAALPAALPAEPPAEAASCDARRRASGESSLPRSWPSMAADL